MKKLKKITEISVIIPVCNEEKNIPLLVERLAVSLKKLSLQTYEVLFIDDGSRDTTYQQLQKAKRRYRFIKIIKLRKNFKKAVAYSVGFHIARYDVILTMDGDLQDNPEEIPLFLEKLEQGYDLVTGWKVTGKGTRRKTALSRIFNMVVSRSFGLTLHDFNCPFKAYRKEVLQGLKIYSGLYRFIPVFAHANGYRITEIQISNSPRLHGKSKYGGKRVLSGLFDFMTAFLLTKFTISPMYLFGSLALITIVIGTSILGYLTWESFHGIAVGSRPLFSLGILLEILGIQFFSIGFIAEMFTRNAVKIESEYIIEEII